MAPLEPWEKVLINAADFLADTHGEIDCMECHQGVDSAGKEEAHTGLVARPSAGSDNLCADCHEEEVLAHSSSLHATQQGYWTAIEDRGGDAHDPALQEMFGNHCASCHTSCGDCHISQPASVGGGFLDGHLLTDRPPMTRTCTACHGSRVGNEYMGKNEGLLADLHFRQERMTCVDCHDGEELHGLPAEGTAAEPPAHRYEGDLGPRCEACHETVVNGDDDIRMHSMHGDTLACQVCHSVTYISCDSCHVAVSETSGNPFFETSASYFTFMIGRNPLQSAERPYEYVLLRHIPVDPESFAFYGDNLLPDFNAVPTWRYTSPHNIQRLTPQTESCNSCHGNPDLFLTADKVAPEEVEANLPVIVEEVPEER